MKRFVRSQAADVLIPETLWSGVNLDEVLDFDWACDWVLKPREGSGAVAFGRGSFRESGISSQTVKTWRHLEAYRVQGIWGYGQSGPGYLLERRIPTADGEPPNDFRLYVFGGKVKLIQVDTPRFQEVQRRFYTPTWEPYDVTQGPTSLAGVIDPPETLGDMVDIAERIGREYDFVRIDLYDVPDGIYFGEITPYPTGGNAKFSDSEFDEMLGSWWTLPGRAAVR